MISLRERTASTALALRCLLAALACAVAGCIAPQRDPGVLVMASGADLESANPLVTIHPLSRQVQRYALYVTLLRYDSTLSPEPYYARRWEWSADHRDLLLHLASDLAWHDGRPTSARDAAFTLLTARDPSTGFSRATELASLDTALAIDDTTLRLRFRAAQPALPALLSELPLVPAHLLERTPRAKMRTAAFNDAPVGNGPFKFVSRQRGARWTFTRNERFSPTLGGAPRLNGFVIAVVDEATTKFAALSSGELDIAGISPTMASLAERDAALRLVTYPVFFGTALCFNTTRPPFDDARVRRAVALSIDRQRIVDVALAGYARASSSPVPPDSPLAWAGAPSRDTATADALLTSAGWQRDGSGSRHRKGVALSIELLTVGSGDNVAEQLVQADLAARGVAVRVRQTEMGVFLTTARAASKSFDLLIAGIPGDLSLSYVGAMFSSAQRGGSLDFTGFHSPELDARIASASNAGDATTRRAAWIEVQQAIDALAPATWLYHSRGLQGISRRVTGVRMDLRGELVTLHDWSLDPLGARR